MSMPPNILPTVSLLGPVSNRTERWSKHGKVELIEAKSATYVFKIDEVGQRSEQDYKLRKLSTYSRLPGKNTQALLTFWRWH